MRLPGAEFASIAVCVGRPGDRAEGGELLREIEKANGQRTDPEPCSSDAIRLTRKEAAARAGLSKDQAMRAIRVANVDEETFEE